MKKQHEQDPLGRRRMLGAMGAALTGMWLPLARAQGKFPEKPVRMIVPYTTGQSADIFGRMLAIQLGEIWSQSVVVENKGGGASIPGMVAGRDADPDGYTLVLGGSGPIGINPGLYPTLPYDPIRDFTPVHGLFLSPLIVVANPDSGFASFQQLVEDARARPEGNQWGVAGLGTSPYLAGELIKAKTGARITTVPYRGSGQMLNDLLGGQIKLGVDTVSAAFSFIKDGRLKALAVTSKERVPQLPDVPTVAECGYKGFEAVGWGGFFVPAKTPAARVAEIEKGIHRAMSLPALQEGITQRGALADLRGSAEFGPFVRAEIPKWGEIIAANDIKMK